MVSEQSAMWWVAHVILESAQGPNPSFFFFLFNFGACWDTGLDLDLDQGLTIINLTLMLFFNILSDKKERQLRHNTGWSNIFAFPWEVSAFWDFTTR